MKLSLLASFILSYAVAEKSSSVAGNLEVWDNIFASREYEVLVHAQANDLDWTEGPVLMINDGGNDDILLFSDVIAAKTYSLDLDKAIHDRTKDITKSGATKNILNKHLHVIKERSGDCPQTDDNWRAEPGGNGIAVLSHMPRKLVMCQHGAQRLAMVDLDTGETRAVASEYGGKRLNGPNDVVVHSENGELFAYFTDPVYAWLEKDRFEDLPYLDERVRSDGPGHCGVYRVKLTENVNSQDDVTNDVELIVSDMMRPNGVDFIGDNLIVSDCCQGSHLNGCKSGTSRWKIFGQKEHESTSSSSWTHIRTIEDTVPANSATGGCADGFAVHEYVDKEEMRKHVLLSSCFGGLCVVDLESGSVITRMFLGGCRISNVAVGKEFVFLTGSCGILTLPLKGTQSNHMHSHTEF
jgi:gluconolactonase